MKKTLISIGVAAAAIAVVLAIVLIPKRNRQTPIVPAENAQEQVADSPVFSKPLSEIGYGVDTIGFSSFSPDGNHFAWSGFKQGSNPANKGFVLNMKTGAVAEIDAGLVRGFKGDSYLTLMTMPGLAVYDAATGKRTNLTVDQNPSDAFVSPNGKLAVMMGGGVTVVNLATGEKNVLDAKQNSGAYAWYPDSVRILGFRENDQNLYEAGKGRDLGFWNAETGAFEALSKSSVKNPRHMEWLVPGKVARVNTGWDDGSHDYLVNVETGETHDLGDTSAALSGGIVADQKRAIVAVLGGGGRDCAFDACKGFVADAEGAKREFALDAGYYRSGLQVVSKDILAYVRRNVGATQSEVYGDEAAVVTYNLRTKKETVVAELPAGNILTLSVSPDGKTWIASSGDRFYRGEF